MWGKVGHWPVQEKVRLNLQDQHGDGGWFAYRRLVRSWRLADARSAGDAYRIRSARAMLQCPDQVRARLIGYSVDALRGQMALIGNVAARGFEVTS